ncbi:hypothetical protein N7541_008047 [Penicillium brevicompactum]|uniref:Uncharacterized protein n=1 Tax=Penicillium brevicompactum TaxID=5074 RepID=A0A9W9UP35_PENBR|nr:hypothetical protein N7541_008047 [Penicillium brevicompactum]
MEKTSSGQGADDEDDGGGPNVLLDLFNEPIFQLSELVTLDPMAPSATGGAAPPVDTLFGMFQPIDGINGLMDAAILSQSESIGDYMDDWFL